MSSPAPGDRQTGVTTRMRAGGQQPPQRVYVDPGRPSDTPQLPAVEVLGAQDAEVRTTDAERVQIRGLEVGHQTLVDLPAQHHRDQVHGLVGSRPQAAFLAERKPETLVQRADLLAAAVHQDGGAIGFLDDADDVLGQVGEIVGLVQVRTADLDDVGCGGLWSRLHHAFVSASTEPGRNSGNLARDQQYAPFVSRFYGTRLTDFD